MDGYEEEERFPLEHVTIAEALRENEVLAERERKHTMVERKSWVLRRLQREEI